MKLIYLICPVRRATEEQLESMRVYVESLEDLGHIVHWPPRDVDQSNDDGGVRICREHRDFLQGCDEVHVWLSDDGGMSIGSHFDLGMAYMLDLIRRSMLEYAEPLRFAVANPERLPDCAEKSFIHILRSLIDESA